MAINLLHLFFLDVLRDQGVARMELQRLQDRQTHGAPRFHRLHLLVRYYNCKMTRHIRHTHFRQQDVLTLLNPAVFFELSTAAT